MILALSVAGAPAQKPIDVSPSGPAARVVATKCVKCSHAPCDCGYSPSYYTSRPRLMRKGPAAAPKVPAAETKKRANVAKKHAPIVPHWSRPRPVTSLTMTSEPEASPLSEEAKIADYLERLEAYLAYFEGRELPGAAPARKLGFLFKRRDSIAPQTLVPTPRRPGATTGLDLSLVEGSATSNSLVPVPRRPSALASVTPKQSLGFQPGLVGTNPFVRAKSGFKKKPYSHHRPDGRRPTRGPRPIGFGVR